MRTTITCGLAALMIAGAGAAGAQQRFGFDPDTNGDGKITLSEMKNARMNRMMEADANHDGKVSKAEWDAMIKQREAQFAQFRANAPPGKGPGGPGGPRPGGGQFRGGNAFKEADLNNDGSVTKAEVERAVVAQFAKLDKAKKGYVTREEMFAQFRGGPPGKAGG